VVGDCSSDVTAKVVCWVEWGRENLGGGKQLGVGLVFWRIERSNGNGVNFGYKCSSGVDV